MRFGIDLFGFRSYHGKLNMAFCVALFVVGASGAATKEGAGADDAGKDASFKRDPFWPVGFVPESVRKATVAAPKTGENRRGITDWSAAMKQVVINGVSSRSNSDFFAVINGGVKRVGDSVSVMHEGAVYTWAVDSIKPPGSVKLRRVSVR